MGCDSYHGGIRFLEADKDVGCLCTFPHKDGRTLDAARVRALAYLGAAVVLAHRGSLEHPYLPMCVPEWMRNEIDRNIRLLERG